MIVLIPYINLLNLSWINNLFFEEYGAFKDGKSCDPDEISNGTLRIASQFLLKNLQCSLKLFYHQKYIQMLGVK